MTHSVRKMRLFSSTCSIALAFTPLPLTRFPPRLLPVPLNASHAGGASSVSFPLPFEPTDTGVAAPLPLASTSCTPFVSTLNLSRMLGSDSDGFLYSGSTYPTGGAKSTSRSVSRTEMAGPGGVTSMMRRRKVSEW